jgi:glycosyltransferase involved in cell wall biosynthesis
MSSQPSSPRFSVIMPVYNGEATLDRALRSVQAQTDDDWEIVAADDGSTDGSGKILRRWAAEDRRIRVVRLEENRGVSAARNAALQVARGEFVVYLDRDDEYYPDYLASVRRLGDRGDVLVFGYDFLYDDGPAAGRPDAWQPAEVRQFLFGEPIATPLGLAHRRWWWEKVGGFNEVWCEEDFEFCRRLARAGAEFVFLPLKSGRYHVRADSRARVPRVTRRERESALANWQAGKLLYGERPLGGFRPKIRRIVFASPHCLVDFTSGAAMATLDGLKLLAGQGFSCEAFCGSMMDAPEETLLEEVLAKQQVAYQARRARVGGYEARMLFTVQQEVPVTVFQGGSTRGLWMSGPEIEAFLAAFQTFCDRNRPDVLVTYGGDPVAQEIVLRAKLRDIPVVFALHNFSYQEAEPFRRVDYVVVPSQFARQHYWEKLGLACQHLPNPIDPRRVVAVQRRPQYVTLVNPEPVKGVYVFARIAEELARRRPDIPLLVVEGRGPSSQLRGAGLDLGRLENLRTMANTPDPRQFYGVSKVVLMPSLWWESSGLVAAEAMANGIPVLASDRGGLPETLGDAGFLFPIPARYTPETTDVPTAAEVEPWVETIVRLWDDGPFYERASHAASARAAQWFPERLAPRYREFFGGIFHQPGPPIAPPAR